MTREHSDIPQSDRMPNAAGVAATPRKPMARTAVMCAMAAVGMLGLAFASKPLYDTFCRVTGFGGTTQVATATAPVTLERVVTVRFDTNVDRRIPLEFEPLEKTRTLRVGENAMTFYRITNTSDAPVRAVASYNVAPFKMGPYFAKLQCFCFEDQTFEPGESVELPVVFFVDPEMADERRLDDVREITLSYTFFESTEAAVADLVAAQERDLGS